MRDHTKLFSDSLLWNFRFLEIAFGSLRELHYQFGLSKRLGYFDGYDIPNCESKIVETEKVLGIAFSLQPKQPE